MPIENGEILLELSDVVKLKFAANLRKFKIGYCINSKIDVLSLLLLFSQSRREQHRKRNENVSDILLTILQRKTCSDLLWQMLRASDVCDISASTFSKRRFGHCDLRRDGRERTV